MAEDGDYAGVMRAFSSYSIAIDRQEWDRLSEAFTDDALWVHADGREFHGLDAIRAQVIGNTPNRPVNALHQPFNLCLTVDGDTATAESDWLFYGANKGSEWGIVSFGNYEDRLARTTDGWRLTYRRIIRHMEY